MMSKNVDIKFISFEVKIFSLICYKLEFLSRSLDDYFFSFSGQIYFQDLCCSKPDLKLPSSPLSPVIDPHLSPDGTMIAYVRDNELHVMNLLSNEQKQLTHGANGNTVVSAYVRILPTFL